MKNERERLPKLLPWLAAKAGIDEGRAEVLWREAVRLAAVQTGERNTAAFHAAAMRRLIELLTEEAERQDAAFFGLKAWARLQASLWGAPAAMLDAAALKAARGWRLIGHSFG